MKDESKTVLIVILIGGILFMITQSGEENVKQVKQERTAAVLKDEVIDSKEAKFKIKTEQEQLTEALWLDLFRKMQRAIPMWYRVFKSYETQRIGRIGLEDWSQVSRINRAMQFLVSTMDEFFPPDRSQSRTKLIREQIRELYQQSEWLVNYDERNTGLSPAPGAQFKLGSKIPSFDVGLRDNEIRNSFNAGGSGKRPDLSDEQIEDRKEGEADSIAKDFGKSKGEADRLIKNLEGENAGEHTAVTHTPSDSAFVQGGGNGKVDNDDGGSRMRDASGTTNDPTKNQAPKKVPQTKPANTLDPGTQFNTAPGEVNSVDPPPAPLKTRQRSQSVPVQGTKRSAYEDEERSKLREETQALFNASSDPAIGKPNATAHELLEDAVDKTGDLEKRNQDPKKTETAGKLKLSIAKYSKDLQKVVDRARNHMNDHPEPNKVDQEYGRALWTKVFQHIPAGFDNIFYAAAFPGTYNPEKDQKYKFSEAQILQVKNTPFYKSWAESFNEINVLYKGFSRKHVADINATQLSESTGRTGKRRKPKDPQDVSR